MRYREGLLLTLSLLILSSAQAAVTSYQFSFSPDCPTKTTYTSYQTTTLVSGWSSGDCQNEDKIRITVSSAQDLLLGYKNSGYGSDTTVTGQSTGNDINMKSKNTDATGYIKLVEVNPSTGAIISTLDTYSYAMTSNTIYTITDLSMLTGTVSSGNSLGILISITPTGSSQLETKYGNYATSEKMNLINVDETSSTVCGNASCDGAETYSTCPEDCCDADCTATSDSTCHSACDTYNGCAYSDSTAKTACDGQSSGASVCYSTSATINCCEAAPSSCSLTEASCYCSSGSCTSCTSGYYCSATPACPSCSTTCDNSCQDSACYGTDPDCDVSGGATTECCGNSNCASGEACSSDCSTETFCSDGVDNDQDGFTDGVDSDCGGTETSCSDGSDNDGDGLVDCADSDCTSGTACATGLCCSGACTAVSCSTDNDCDDSNACTTDSCSNAGTCSSSCSNTAVTACSGGDSCCPSGCSYTSDADCTASCGNDVCETGETCSNCPGDCGCSGSELCCSSTCTDPCDTNNDCDDSNACTTDVCNSAGTCSYACGYTTTTTCVNSDNCCPSGCTSYTDNDCSIACGNGICELTETCSNCPGDCGACEVTLGTCGNGICEEDYNATYSETCSTCTTDCGACPVGTGLGVCGNNVCESNEDINNCPRDCDPSSVTADILTPIGGNTYMRGETINLTVNITYDENIKGLNAEVSVNTPIGILFLGDTDKDGVYTKTIIIPSNASTGTWSLDVSAKKGVTGAASRSIVVSDSLMATINTDKSTYTKNERIIITGDVNNVRGEPVNTTISLLINNETITTSSTNGFYNTRHLTNILDPTGTWDIIVKAIDQYNNSGTKTMNVEVNEPEEGTYYIITFTSPLRGVVNRGDKITITTEVKLGNTLINDANVHAVMPDGEEITLIQIDEGLYSESATISNDAKLGSWNLEGVAEKESFIGVSSVNMNIRKADISLKILSPTKSTYSVGEDMNIVVEATYPDGSPVELPQINITLGDKSIILENQGEGVYSTSYSVSESDEDLSVNIILIDESNNTGNQEFSISVSGTSLLHYFKAYPYIVWPVIAVGVAGLVMASLGFIKKENITGLKNKKKELIELKKKTQQNYFVEQSISKERYDELMTKYNSEIDSIKNKIKKMKSKDRGKT